MDLYPFASAPFLEFLSNSLDVRDHHTDVTVAVVGCAGVVYVGFVLR